MADRTAGQARRRLVNDQICSVRSGSYSHMRSAEAFLQVLQRLTCRQRLRRHQRPPFSKQAVMLC